MGTFSCWSFTLKAFNFFFFFLFRFAAPTTRPTTPPATSSPPSAPWREPRRATSCTWTTSGPANVSWHRETFESEPKETQTQRRSTLQCSLNVPWMFPERSLSACWLFALLWLMGGSQDPSWHAGCISPSVQTDSVWGEASGPEGSDGDQGSIRSHRTQVVTVDLFVS